MLPDCSLEFYLYRSAVSQMQKLIPPPTDSQELGMVPSFKTRIGRNVAVHASLTSRTSAFLVHSTLFFPGPLQTKVLCVDLLPIRLLLVSF